MGWRIGVDIGGTFTDVALVEDTSGRIGISNTMNTPVEILEMAFPLRIERYEVPSTVM